MASKVTTPSIAIIGMACRFPGARTYGEFWDNLIAGKDTISRSGGDASDTGATAQTSNKTRVSAVGRIEGTEYFDADHFRVPPAEAITMDPQQRVLLEVASAALDDASYAGDRSDAIVGVFVGSGENTYFRDFVAPTVGAEHFDDLRIVTGNGKHFLASRLAFKLGLTGPTIVVQAGCATGLTAVSLACSALAAGECDLAVAGGISLLMPDVDGYAYAPGGILSSDGYCRTLDAMADGTVPGSGAGLVVLKRDAEASRDLDHRHAVIRGWAINNDGGSRAGFTAPNVSGQETVIRTAMARAEVRPSDVGFIELHGTATALGDVVEIEALRRVYEAEDATPSSCHLGSVKPNIGHTDAAAGVAGLIKAALAVENDAIPPMVNFTELNPEIDFTGTPLVVSGIPASFGEGRPRIAAVSSFSLGGNNAHVLVQQAEEVSAESRKDRHEAGSERVLALSARTPEELLRLRALIAANLEALSPDAGVPLADVAYSMAVGRPRYAHRWAAMAGTTTEAVEALRAAYAPRQTTARWSLQVYGELTSLAKMGEAQIEAEPLIRSIVKELVGEGLLSTLDPSRAAAVSVIAAARALTAVGLDFGRYTGPQWLQPAFDWLRDEGTRSDLDSVLNACAHQAQQRLDTGVVRDAPGIVLVGEDFSLGGSLAAAWTAGASVEWGALYAGEGRRRVPLPTYPFTHERFWLERPRSTAVTSAMAPVTDRSAELGSVIERVWCEVLGLVSIEPEAHFVDDLGGDSVFAVEIGARLGEELHAELPLDLPFLAPTLTQATAFVRDALDRTGSPEVAR